MTDTEQWMNQALKHQHATLKMLVKQRSLLQQDIDSTLKTLAQMESDVQNNRPVSPYRGKLYRLNVNGTGFEVQNEFGGWDDSPVEIDLIIAFGSLLGMKLK